MLREFKEFAMRGSAIDMAVGIIVGAALGAIVKSLVDDVIMPPIGLLLGNVELSNLKKSPYCLSAVALGATRCPQRNIRA